MPEIADRWAAALLFAAPFLFAADWQPSGPFGGNVLVVATDPHRPSVVLAGARNGLLFRSDDRAKTWKRIAFDRPISGAVQALVIDPSDSAHYMAGISGEDSTTAGLWESGLYESGLYESIDAGAHWQQAPALRGASIEALKVFAKDSRIRAVATRHGLFVTRDAGKTWARISPASNPELQDITTVAFDAANPNIIYAGTPHLPWKTMDGGANWYSVRDGMLDDSDVFSIFIDPAHPSRVFASACSGIYSSTNSGAAWKLLDGIPGTSRRTHVITQDARRPQVMYAGTTAGLFKSWNGGGRWNRLNGLQINSIAFDPVDSRTLYLATERGGIVVTHDGGETLIPMNQGLLSRNVSSVALGSGAMYLSTIYEGAEGGVFASTDHGRSWRKSSFSGGNVRALSANAQTVYAATVDRIYRSVDSARTWSPWESSPFSGEIHALQIGGNGALLVGTSQGLYPAQGSKQPVLAVFGSLQQLLVNTELGLFVSNNSGAWTPVRSTDRSTVYDAATSCTGDALIATSQGLRRVTGGALEPVRGLSSDTVSAVAFHPRRCQEAYAAQFGVIYVSRDAGLTWNPLPGTNVGTIEKLWIDPALPARLFALVRGQGVLFRDLD